MSKDIVAGLLLMVFIALSAGTMNQMNQLWPGMEPVVNAIACGVCAGIGFWVRGECVRDQIERMQRGGKEMCDRMVRAEMENRDLKAKSHARE